MARILQPTNQPTNQFNRLIRFACLALVALLAGLLPAGCGSGDSEVLPVEEPLAMPALVATAGDGQVTLSWIDVGGERYDLLYSTDPDFDPVNYSVYAGGTMRVDVNSPHVETGLVNGTTYYFALDAWQGGQVAATSVKVSATPEIANPVYVSALPDTGQTQSYTSTFGEDSDYTINPPSYTDNGNSTVTDNVTGLIWQQSDDNITRTWDAADSYCTGLSLAGHLDWRLPTKKELVGIVDYGVYSPAIDPIFTGTKVSYYWSSTTYASYVNGAWDVYFGDGHVYGSNKSYGGYVRCVRGGQ